ncbi:N,N-dimethylformamidase beta subunit family domain-containing protein [Nonomuraea sp. NPDC047897]|uniref:N,N-dimethylformamidase beta subunit family domain-containing protein n=1 Tax=Nonomuraea sp. NPDC047897 TaxID=3364346 RepID=UPI00371A2AF5
MRKPIAALALLALGCGAAAPHAAAAPGTAAAPRAAASATASPAAAGPAVAGPAAAGPVTAAEARTDGERDRASWRIARQGAEREIEGYADRVSVLPGERFRLLVSTTAPAFTARAFRMGARATQVWRSGPLDGVRQPPALMVEDMVTAAHWKPSVTVDTTGWPEGAYLVRLDASTGAQRYVPVTVRSASTRGRVVLVNAVTTWQAYNGWGGRSLYEGPGGFAGRSRKVTFDRPYDGTGARHFLAFERDAIAVAERSGVPLAYLTSLDLRPGALDGARAVVSLGHDEYYSPGMRAALTRARDRGVNLAFLGAGAVFWRIALHGRMIMCDKESECLPWQVSEPDNALVGQGFDCYPAEAAYVVSRPGHWIFKGTRGRRFPGLAGVETDRVSPRSPAGVQVLARSPVDCGGRATEGTTTYYTAPGGAGVFAAGTTRWVCGMRGRRCGHGVTGAAAAFTRRATRNLLTRFARGPAADPAAHPAAHPAADPAARAAARPGR